MINNPKDIMEILDIIDSLDSKDLHKIIDEAERKMRERGELEDD